MKQIIDDYSPILEGVTVEELKEKVKEEPKQNTNKNLQQKDSQQDSLHLNDATDGEDIPVGE
jgi:hypothetical protein